MYSTPLSEIADARISGRNPPCMFQEEVIKQYEISGLLLYEHFGVNSNPVGAANVV
jgi:hypothetical protein